MLLVGSTHAWILPKYNHNAEFYNALRLLPEIESKKNCTAWNMCRMVSFHLYAVGIGFESVRRELNISWSPGIQLHRGSLRVDSTVCGVVVLAAIVKHTIVYFFCFYF